MSGKKITRWAVISTDTDAGDYEYMGWVDTYALREDAVHAAEFAAEADAAELGLRLQVSENLSHEPYMWVLDTADSGGYRCIVRRLQKIEIPVEEVEVLL